LFHLNQDGLEIQAIEEKQVLFMLRSYGLDRVFSIFNFSGSLTEIRAFFQTGHWRKVLDSSSTEWSGSGSSTPKSIQSDGFDVSLELNPFSFVLYRSEM
jgi:hypothetical protein